KAKYQRNANNETNNETNNEVNNEINNEVNNEANNKANNKANNEANNAFKRLLQAVPKVNTYRLLVYIGNLKRSRRCQRQIQWEAAVRTSKLELFWLQVTMDVSSSSLDNNSETETEFASEIEDNVNLYNLAIEQLENKVKSNSHNEIESARLNAMLSYLRLVKCGEEKTKASVTVTKATEKNIYRACSIQA
ncbi:15489_t:CDS:2, partial [Dentiscutata heterogama]